MKRAIRGRAASTHEVFCQGTSPAMGCRGVHRRNPSSGPMYRVARCPSMTKFRSVGASSIDPPPHSLSRQGREIGLDRENAREILGSGRAMGRAGLASIGLFKA